MISAASPNFVTRLANPSACWLRAAALRAAVLVIESIFFVIEVRRTRPSSLTSVDRAVEGAYWAISSTGSA